MWGWIVLGIFVLLIASILAIRVTFIVSYDKKWTTRIRIFVIEREINLTKIIEGVLFPNQVIEEKKEEKKEEKAAPATPAPPAKDPLAPIKAIYSKDGVAGLIEFFQNLLETMGKAVGVFFRHFIIADLHIKLVTSSTDAAKTARAHGRLCGVYYPFIGTIRSGMTVHHFSEEIYADFLAPESVQEIYFKGSICVKNLLGIVLAAAKTFLVNLIKSKKTGNSSVKTRKKNTK